MTATEGIPTAAILIIGDEILSGRTLDTNIGTIARFLTPRGIDLREVRVVADDEDAIVAAVRALGAANTYVFTTGGIGPTHDDITAGAIARTFGVPLLIDPRAVALLVERYPAAQLTEPRLRMARIPEGADLIANSVSGAPGFRIGNVYVMAGIPSVMAAMLEALGPMLVGGAPMLSRTVPAGLGESVIAEGLEAIQHSYPDVAIGSYPQPGAGGGFWTELVLRARDPVRLDAASAEVARLVDEAGGAIRD